MDIALTASPADPGTGHLPRGVILAPLVSEPLVLVCPAGHPLSGRSRVTVTDLAGETILRFPPGWGVRATVDRVLGADPSAITRGHRDLAAVPVDDPRLAWGLFAAINASRQPTAAATALLAELTQAAIHLPAAGWITS
jgi:LysR substrate binding domain